MIELAIRETSTHLQANLVYNNSLISKPQSEFLATTVSHVLRQIVTKDGILLRDLDLVSKEHLEYIWSWNGVQPQPVSACVQDLIAENVRSRPQSEAIHSWDGRLTYAQLDSSSTKLAHELVRVGVVAETIVPLCFEKSLWAIVAILGVVKAGGAIVNIDPKQPKARSKGILEDVGAKVVLTSRKNAGMWNGEYDVLTVDEDAIHRLPEKGSAPSTPVGPRNTLYLIFTSGSTGKPKGCVVEHESFLTAAAQQREYGNLRGSSRLLQMTSYSFDVSMLEIFTALTAGACICVPGEEDVVKGIVSVINQYRISWTFMTPSVARVVAPKDVPTLRTLALGGEALSAVDVRTWAEHLQLVNGYGPTECSVAATINPHLTKNTDPANIGIGRGALCWVVDANDHHKLVPIGAIGELLIHGPIVARGYYGNQEKTDEVFIQNPDFLPKDGTVHRLYKTGDLVRNNSDGSINFIGRKDHQVKLRGQRLELGEIEHNLFADTLVRHAMVLLPQVGFCRQNLVAILSLHSIPESTSAADEIKLVGAAADRGQGELVAPIRERLTQQLPSYMVPTIWVVLESIPMSVSGKMNRVLMTRWLTDMTEDVYNRVAEVDTQTELVAPATETELLLQSIWSVVLGIDPFSIGSNRSFLSMGGDSITAMQVVAQCRAQGLRLTLQDVVQSKSLAELADRASTKSLDPSSGAVELAADRVQRLTGYDLSKVALTDLEQVEDVYGCSPMQEGILLSQVKDPSTYAIRQVFHALPVGPRPLSVDRMAQAWSKLVRRHPLLRTIFVDDLSDESLFHQIQLRDVEASLTTRSCPGSKQEVVALLARQPAAQYAVGQPHHHVTLCESAEGTVSFMLEINHALIDGGSTEVVIRELAEAYDGTLPSEVGPTYANYIAYIQSQSEEVSLAYWKRYLAETQPCLLPLYDGDRDKPNEPRIRSVEFSRGKEILRFCQTNEITVANFMATAWALLLRAYTASDDICFGFVASGRDVPIDGIEDLVGACINMLVCRFKFENNSRVAEVAREAQENYFKSLPHQHISLAKIQNALGMSGMALFNTIMSLQREVSSDARNGQSISFEEANDEDPIDVSE